MSDSKKHQKSGEGSTNLQADFVTINQGIPVETVREIITDLFRASFEDLRSLTEKTARMRVEAMMDDFLTRLQAGLSSPAQRALRNEDPEPSGRIVAVPELDHRVARALPPGSRFAVQPLCVHHDLSDFRCGHEEIDLLIPAFQRRIAERELDEFVTIVVVDTHDRQPVGRVVGIVSVVDLELTGEADADGSRLGGLCLFYVLLAVDVRYQWKYGILKALLYELDSLRRRRYSLEHDYIGELAAPHPNCNTGIERFLRRNGFSRLRTDTALWYRPKAILSDATHV